MLRKAPSTNLANQHLAGTSEIRDEKGDLENRGWGSSLIRPPAKAPVKQGKKPKEKEILVCPFCGNDNVVQAGIPFPDKDGQTSCYYQCQSTRTKRGCGYLDYREAFIPQKKILVNGEPKKDL